MAHDVKNNKNNDYKTNFQMENVTLVFTFCHLKNRENYTCLRFSLWLQINQRNNVRQKTRPKLLTQFTLD